MHRLITLALQTVLSFHTDLSTYLSPLFAFCTAAWKNSSEKKSKEPTKITLALLRAWRPAISSVFVPTAWGNCTHTESFIWTFSEVEGSNNFFMSQQATFVRTILSRQEMFCRNKHVLWQNYCRHKNDTGGSSCQWQWSPSWRTTLNCKVRASPFWQPSLDSALKVNSSAMTISQLASSAMVFPRCTIRTASENMQNNQVLPPAEHVWYYWNEANQV